MNRKAKNYEVSEAKIIQETELRRLIEFMNPFVDKAISEKKNLNYINDYYMIRLDSLTGLRVSELANIKIKDITNDNIRVIGKGSKARNLPLGTQSKELLKLFFELKQTMLGQGISPDSYLFLNRDGNPFNRFSLNKRFKFWAKKAGVNERLSFHSIRHYFATYLLNNSFNLAETQRILGHSSITVTSQYLHFTIETKAKVSAAL